MIETEKRVYGSGQLLSETIVECPGSTDVVFKPGKRLAHHPGNILFHDLIMSVADEYTTTTSKRGIYRWLFLEIKEKRKGRFLKWDDEEYWTEIKDETQVTVKISTFCKTVLRTRKATKENTSLVESSTTAFANNKRKRCEGTPCSNNSDT